MSSTSRFPQHLLGRAEGVGGEHQDAELRHQTSETLLYPWEELPPEAVVPCVPCVLTLPGGGLFFGAETPAVSTPLGGAAPESEGPG